MRYVETNSYKQKKRAFIRTGSFQTLYGQDKTATLQRLAF